LYKKSPVITPSTPSRFLDRRGYVQARFPTVIQCLHLSWAAFGHHRALLVLLTVVLQLEQGWFPWFCWHFGHTMLCISYSSRGRRYNGTLRYCKPINFPYFRCVPSPPKITLPTVTKLWAFSPPKICFLPVLKITTENQLVYSISSKKELVSSGYGHTGRLNVCAGRRCWSGRFVKRYVLRWQLLSPLLEAVQGRLGMCNYGCIHRKAHGQIAWQKLPVNKCCGRCHP